MSIPSKMQTSMFYVDIPKSDKIIPFLLYCKRNNIHVKHDMYLIDDINVYKNAILQKKITPSQFIELSESNEELMDMIMDCENTPEQERILQEFYRKVCECA